MIYFVTKQLDLFESYPADLIKKADVTEVFKALENVDQIAVDTETTGLVIHDCSVNLIQLSDGQGDEYVIDTTTVDIKLFKDLLENATVLMANAAYDIQILFKYGIVCSKVIDVYLQEMVLTTGLLLPSGSRSLVNLVSKYTDMTITKDSAWKTPFTVRGITYAAEDVMALHKINEAQKILLKKENLLATASLENKFVVPLAYMSFCGIHLNRQKWLDKMEDDKAKLQASLNKLNDWIIANMPSTSKFIDNQGDLFTQEFQSVTLNWNSPKKVGELFREIGIDTFDVKHNKNTVDIKYLAKFIKDFPILSLYKEYSQNSKVVSTYGQTYLDQINKTTGRIHSHFKQIKDTGRISSDDPNIQNLPADHTRTCITAEKGNVIVGSDYSGQETYTLADKSKDATYLAYINEPDKDMHALMAQSIYPELRSLTHAEIKKNHKDKRQFVKAATFAIPYGGNGQTIANNLGIDIETANKAYNNYMSMFPNLKNYFKRAAEAPLKQGYVLICGVSGRRSYLSGFDTFLELQKQIKAKGFWDKYKQEKAKGSQLFKSTYGPKVREFFKLKGIFERKGLNYPIQGTAANMTKLASIYLMKWILTNNYTFQVKIIVMAHDEIQLECPENLGEAVKTALQDCMERAAKKFCPTVTITADAEISTYWKH